MLARIPSATSVLIRRRLTRFLSSRATSVLSELDIPTSDSVELSGVYDGSWGGTGDLFESVCPATGEVLARVRSVCFLLVTQTGMDCDRLAM